MAALNDLVSQAVDLVVHTVRTPQGPRVNQIACVEDLTVEAGGTSFTITEVFKRSIHSGRLEWTGHIPQRATEAMANAGINIRTILPHEAPMPAPHVTPGTTQ